MLLAECLSWSKKDLIHKMKQRNERKQKKLLPLTKGNDRNGEKKCQSMSEKVKVKFVFLLLSFKIMSVFVIR